MSVDGKVSTTLPASTASMSLELVAATSLFKHNLGNPELLLLTQALDDLSFHLNVWLAALKAFPEGSRSHQQSISRSQRVTCNEACHPGFESTPCLIRGTQIGHGKKGLTARERSTIYPS